MNLKVRRIRPDKLAKSQKTKESTQKHGKPEQTIIGERTRQKIRFQAGRRDYARLGTYTCEIRVS